MQERTKFFRSAGVSPVPFLTKGAYQERTMVSSPFRAEEQRIQLQPKFVMRGSPRPGRVSNPRRTREAAGNRSTMVVSQVGAASPQSISKDRNTGGTPALRRWGDLCSPAQVAGFSTPGGHGTKTSIPRDAGFAAPMTCYVGVGCCRMLVNPATAG